MEFWKTFQHAIPILKSPIWYSNIIRHIRIFSKRHHIARKIPAFIGVCVLFFGILTYYKLTTGGNEAIQSNSVLVLLYIDVMLVLLLAGIVARRVVELWSERRRGKIGSKLHVNIVALFSIITILPAILVSLFAGVFVNIGLQAWFSEPVKSAISESRAVALSYLDEHKRSLKFEALALSNAISSDLGEVFTIENKAKRREIIDHYLTQQEQARFLNEILLIQGDDQSIIGKSMLTFALEVDFISPEDLRAAKSEPVVIREYSDRVRAVVLLDPFTETYLFIGKSIDRDVLRHVEQTETAFSTFNSLEIQKSGMALSFLVLFSVVSLLLLLLAIWFGMTIANAIISPITELIIASKQVATGNLDTQVIFPPMNNEMDQLIASFNAMTKKLKSQQTALVSTEKQAAWSDVARKIAHEIKNPLTPIQLSAERLKKKYSPTMGADRTFNNCIDTIIRQVGKIGNLVTEFSNFARMPEPVIIDHNLLAIVEVCVNLEKTANPQIQYKTISTSANIRFQCDENQISGVVTNLLQNASNALLESDTTADKKIDIAIEKKQDIITLTVDDNGTGFPKTGREKLLEPYYTTRDKGTGLGLAIVEKIVTDHDGCMALLDSPLGGARVLIEFNLKNGKGE